MMILTPTIGEKGFNATLFECIDSALASVLGREAVSTFYFAIQESHRLSDEDFSKKPFEFLEYFKILVGPAAFGIVEPAVIDQIRTTFGIEENVRNLSRLLDIARRNFLLF
jgi:hypothetical protein